MKNITGIGANKVLYNDIKNKKKELIMKPKELER